MTIPALRIGNLKAQRPIIQGAMGVGISLSNLAAAVANQGGVGVIAGVQIGFGEPDFEDNHEAANLRALKKQIKRARALSPGGILGVNLLAAINNYEDMAKAAVEEGIDLIISGAGLPKGLPALTEGSDTKLAPIVSSGKAAALICKVWLKRFNKVPDLVIVEGPLAGGHLGFSKEELNNPNCPSLETLVLETLSALKPFEEASGQPIPVVAAGGIYTGQDIAHYLKLGASGVQMATRFVATEECDVHKNFKKAYLQASEADIQLVDSPVGMPGRAISNPFTEEITAGKRPIQKCYNCLKPCDPKSTPYCISEALINSCLGDTEDGLVFAGKNAHKLTNISSVQALMDELMTETELYFHE